MLTGDYAGEQARWASTPIEVGRPLAKPTPIFAKLDPKLGETGPEWAPIHPRVSRLHVRQARSRPVPPPEPLPAPIVDAHTHLDACGCVDAADVAAAMDRAAAVGRDPGGDGGRRPGLGPLGGAGRALGRRVVAAVALHPTRTAAVTDADHAEIERLAARPAGGRGRGDRAGLLLGLLARLPPSRSPSAGTSTWPSGSASR